MKGRHFMNIRTASVAFVVALPACFGAGAVAQTYGGERQPSSEDSAAGDRGQQRQQMKDQFDRESESGRAYGRTVQGTISEIRNVQLPGQDEAWTVARVKTHDGETKTVLLGPPQRLQRLNLQPGDEITVQGMVAGSRERGLIAAQRIESGGQTISFARSFQFDQDQTFGYEEPQEEMGGQPGMRAMKREVEGTISDIRPVRMPGQDQTFLIASVQTPEGDTKTVLLGPEDRVQRLDLKPGDHVSVQALLAPGHGRGIFAAQRIQSNGRSVTLARTFMGDDGFGGSDQQQMASGRGYGRTVEGTITQLRTVNLPEQDQPWVVAGVQTPDGRTTTVLLGPEQRLRQLDLKEGDDIFVRGVVAGAQGRGLFAAQRVESGGKAVTMAGAMQMPEGQVYGYADDQMSDQDGAMRSVSRHVSGTITDVRTVNLPGQDQAWMIAKVEQPDGGTCTVLLGPEDRVKQYDVQPGDRVNVDGFIAGSRERGVLAARRVQINGQTFTTGGAMSPQQFEERREERHH